MEELRNVLTFMTLAHLIDASYDFQGNPVMLTDTLVEIYWYGCFQKMLLILLDLLMYMYINVHNNVV